MTRRAALGTVASLVGGVTGCAGLLDREPFPIQRSWQTEFRDPSSVAMTAAGQLLAGSDSPFHDRPIVAGLDARTGETTWTVTVAKGEKSLPASAMASYAISKAETMVAVDAAAGETVWKRRLEPIDAADPGVVEFAPIPLGDRIVVPISGTEDDVPDRLVGIARADGETLFTHSLSASLSGAPGATSGGVVVPWSTVVCFSSSGLAKSDGRGILAVRCRPLGLLPGPHTSRRHRGTAGAGDRDRHSRLARLAGQHCIRTAVGDRRSGVRRRRGLHLRAFDRPRASSCGAMTSGTP